MAFPSGFALKSPYWQNMISLVSQYDPNFDAVNFNARPRPGKRSPRARGQSLNALNTVMGTWTSSTRPGQTSTTPVSRC